MERKLDLLVEKSFVNSFSFPPSFGEEKLRERKKEFEREKKNSREAERKNEKRRRERMCPSRT